MLNKKEIEKAKEDLRFFNEGDYITKEMNRSAKILEKYIEELESDNCVSNNSIIFKRRIKNNNVQL